MSQQALVELDDRNSVDQPDRPSRTDIATDKALYKQLRNELAAAGCFEFAPWATAGNMGLVLAVYSAGYATLLLSPDWVIRLPVLILLACAQVHGGFLAHEALEQG